jgi:hypothetical protein
MAEFIANEPSLDHRSVAQFQHPKLVRTGWNGVGRNNRKHEHYAYQNILFHFFKIGFVLFGPCAHASVIAATKQYVI